VPQADVIFRAARGGLRAFYEVLPSLRDSSTHVRRAVILAGTEGLKPLSLVTFFAAAKKVTAAPHRGDA
jgi:hypothetical protein